MGRPPNPLRDRAVQLLHEGQTIAQVVQETGAPVGSVGRWAAEAGIAGALGRRRADEPPEGARLALEGLRQRREAIAAGEAPESYRALARRVGLPEGTVRSLERRWLSEG